jgi:hypothetical protein
MDSADRLVPGYPRILLIVGVSGGCDASDLQSKKRIFENLPSSDLLQHKQDFASIQTLFISTSQGISRNIAPILNKFQRRDDYERLNFE